MSKAVRRYTPDAIIFALVALWLASATGCASTKWVTLRSAPKSSLADQLQLSSYSGPRPSDRTMQLLRFYNLADEAQGPPQPLIEKLQAILDREPSPDKVYAIAEMAYLGARKLQSKDPGQACDLYGAAVLHAYRYLFDERFAQGRNPYDPLFRRACDIYNEALEAALRIEFKGDQLLPGKTTTIQTAHGPYDITTVLRGGEWKPQEFKRFDFVSSYQISGLRNLYQSYGLGVPLIAVRKSYAHEPAAARYYPANLSFPVTAFLRPANMMDGDNSADPNRHRALLELYDPLVTSNLQLANMRVPLESDLTTPLAYFLSDSQMDNMANDGLLHPDSLLQVRPGARTQVRPGAHEPKVMGLYMIQPYQRGKIPVLMVHGLWSSPMTWMEMFNDLRSQPEIRDRYQFWFYLYPTAQPFWITAAQLRSDLAELRYTLDPKHEEPALDQMVLIGHSMGGLIAELQTMPSDDKIWKLVSSENISQIKTDAEMRNKLEYCFYFQPNPSIRRVISIATPHQGSRFSNITTQWLVGKLIRDSLLKLPMMLTQEQLFHDNPQAFPADSLLRIDTSIYSLSPANPIFPVMYAAARPPWVKYHNIIGQVPPHGLFGMLAAGGDGVVSVESAHLPNAESEIVVPADHMTVHQHPAAVLEVRRILLEHLADLEAFPGNRAAANAENAAMR